MSEIADRILDFFVCIECRAVICTLQQDQGRIPDLIPCVVTPRCPGKMASARAHLGPEELPQAGQPTWVWYRPSDRELCRHDPEVRAHVEERNGLLLRQIGFPIKEHGAPIFQGEMMVCCMCLKQLKSHPRIETDWDGLQFDDTVYYVCPAERAPRKASSAERKAAYHRIFARILGSPKLPEDVEIQLREYHKPVRRRMS